jgi:hypothetical protein
MVPGYNLVTPCLETQVQIEFGVIPQNQGAHRKLKINTFK